MSSTTIGSIYGRARCFPKAEPQVVKALMNMATRRLERHRRSAFLTLAR